MKSWSWLVERQLSVARWPYILCAAVGMAYGISQLLSKDYTLAALGLVIVLLCCLHYLRPTIIVWLVVLTASLVVATTNALDIRSGNFVVYFAWLGTACGAAALTILFRPQTNRTLTALLLLLCAAGAIALVYAKYELDYVLRPLKPPRLFVYEEDPRYRFHNISDAELLSLLDRDMVLVHRMRDLPASIRQGFTEQDGDRMLIADQGKKIRSKMQVSRYENAELLFGAVDSRYTVMYIKVDWFPGYTGYEAIFYELSPNGRVASDSELTCKAPASTLAELKRFIGNGTCFAVHRHSALPYRNHPYSPPQLSAPSPV